MSSQIKKIFSEKSVSLYNEELETFVPSSHLQREICFVLKGRSCNQVFKASPGTVFLLNKQVIHAFGYRQNDADLEHLWLFLCGSKNSASLMKVVENGNYSLAANVALDNGECDELITQWDKLDSLPEANDGIVFEYMHDALEKLLAEIRHKLREEKRKSMHILDGAVIEKIKRYICMTNTRNCSLEQLEQISGYNRFYLAHRFKEYEKCTVNEYINQVRIDYTRKALQSGLRQKEIAFELGFSSPSNFWLWFQKHRSEIENSPLLTEA